MENVVHIFLSVSLQCTFVHMQKCLLLKIELSMDLSWPRICRVERIGEKMNHVFWGLRSIYDIKSCIPFLKQLAFFNVLTSNIGSICPQNSKWIIGLSCRALKGGDKLKKGFIILFLFTLSNRNYRMIQKLGKWWIIWSQGGRNGLRSEARKSK